MTTLTLQIDSHVADRAEAVARAQATTLSMLVQEYLDQLGRTAHESRTQQVQHLLVTLREISRPLGGKPWLDRDEFHER